MKIPFGDEWKLTVNYTYNDGRDLSNGGEQTAADAAVPYRQRHARLETAGRLVLLRHGQLYRSAARGERHRQNAGGYTCLTSVQHGRSPKREIALRGAERG